MHDPDIMERSAMVTPQSLCQWVGSPSLSLSRALLILPEKMTVVCVGWALACTILNFFA